MNRFEIFFILPKTYNSAMAHQNSVWFIGANNDSACGVVGRSKSLKLCEWSKQIYNVTKITPGSHFNIFTISSAKDECAVFGFIRRYQQLLPFQMNTFYIITQSILLLCFKYFGNYFNSFYLLQPMAALSYLFSASQKIDIIYIHVFAIALLIFLL